MPDVVEYAIRGIPMGCVFALVAIGIVLTYKTSGVLNLAFGAQAYVSAALYYTLRDPDRLGWPMVPAVVVSVLIVAPALGWFLDRALYRHLRTAPPVAKLVVSLGLLVAIPQIVNLDFLLGSQAKLAPPGVASEDPIYLAGINTSANEIVTVAVAVLSVLGLGLLFRRTNLGLQMRAVVESPRMTQLAGVNADRVGSFAWMLSSLFAGLAGVLVAPLFAQLTDLDFFGLLIAALAAAVFARLVSIPMAFAGGIALGVGQALAAGVLPADNVLSTGFRSVLPFAVLFGLLLFWPGLRDRSGSGDPLAGVDPPPPSPGGFVRPHWMTVLNRSLAGTALVVFVVATLAVFDEFWLRVITQGIILSLIFLSVTVVVGLAGQISLCQAAFAAVGAFATAQLVEKTGMSVLVAMIVGAVIAAALGALIALPALRLSGIYLALATLAFAVMFENVLVPMEAISGPTRQLKVPRPLLAGIDFANNRAFLLLCTALLALVAGIVLLIRNGTTGRALTAMRSSELGVASLGLSTGRLKVIAFAVSAAIAGFGGGLMATFERQMGRQVYQANFTFFVGLVWVVLVITLGARTVPGAVTGGLSFVLFRQILEKVLGVSATLAGSVSFILFGLGAITYAKHPEGIVEAQTQRFVRLVSRRRSRPPDGAPTAADPMAPVEAQP